MPMGTPWKGRPGDAVSRSALRADASRRYSVVCVLADKLEEELDRRPLRTEGHNKGGWILLDYGDLIVHILMPDLREFYSLETFWGHGQIVALPEMQPKNPLPTVDLYGSTPEADFDESDLEDSELEDDQSAES